MLGTSYKEKADFTFQYYPVSLGGKLTEQVKGGKRTITATQKKSGVYMSSANYLLAHTGIDCGGKSLQQYLSDNNSDPYFDEMYFGDATETAKVVISGLANDSYTELGKVQSATYSLKQTATATIAFPNKCTNKGDLGSDNVTLTCASVKPLKIKFALNAAGSMSIPQQQ